MSQADILNPFVVFIAYLGVGALIYLAGKWLAPPLNASGWKLSPYACGEVAPEKKLRPNYNFYHVVYLFTILHVGALVTCTAFGITAYSLPLIYMSLLMFGMAVLVAR
jgi:NADH:ubiquinone oxidoreductase subunit 3 (subunit A)